MKEIDALKSQHDCELEALRATSARHDAQVASLRAALARREKELYERDAALARREKELDERDARRCKELDERDAQLATLRAEAAERERDEIERREILRDELDELERARERRGRESDLAVECVADEESAAERFRPMTEATALRLAESLLALRDEVKLVDAARIEVGEESSGIGGLERECDGSVSLCSTSGSKEEEVVWLREEEVLGEKWRREEEVKVEWEVMGGRWELGKEKEGGDEWWCEKGDVLEEHWELGKEKEGGDEWWWEKGDASVVVKEGSSRGRGPTGCQRLGVEFDGGGVK
jgi:hypothetical protein